MPQVQQTVAINIVVRGTGDKRTVESLEQPLEKVRIAARLAGQAINVHIVGALRRALNMATLLQQQIGGVATLAGAAGALNATTAATAAQNAVNTTAITQQRQLNTLWQQNIHK